MRIDKCPFCEGKLKVEKVKCGSCHMSVEGAFFTSPLLNLPAAHQEFIEMFVVSSGSLKEMARKLGVSYPTVRSRLDEIIQALQEEINNREEYKSRILDQVEQGKMDPKEAAEIIKNL